MQKTTYYLSLSFLILIFILLNVSLYSYIKNHDHYNELLEKKANNIVSFGDSPRGDIYDVKGNLLVTSTKVNNIGFAYQKGIKLLDVAQALSQYTNFTNVDKEILKDYYILLYPTKTRDLISDNEYQLLQKRKLTIDVINERKKGRITDEMLSVLSDKDCNIAYIYYLMNKGTRFSNKIIIENVSDDLYQTIMDSNIPGIINIITYKRTYLYDSYINQIMGSIGNIPKKQLNDFLTQGYILSDKVGTSYLESYYESFLAGKRAIYEVNMDYSLKEVKPREKGADLTLEIDIELQLELEEMLKEQLVSLKKLKNTEYFNKAYIIISNPKTGAIKSMVGIELLNNYSNTPVFKNITTDIFSKSFIPGSVIKGASMTVGYQNNLIIPGKKINDSCVKLYNVPAKCSFKRLGLVDDIKALTWSSNYYQFITAIKSTGNKYKNNMLLKVSDEDFLRYRNTFKEYGLGTKTGIDINDEYTGITGKKIASDLLLNLSIGQYDTYTALGLTQYINTIANDGNRIQLSLMNHISKNNELLLSNEVISLNKVNISEENISRIQSGFKEVLTIGTGRGYMKKEYDPAGKTGTSESFIDTNGDLINDTKTITSTSVMYAPASNPEYSIVIITPDVSHYEGKTDYIAPINSKISKNVAKILFEK